MQKVHIVGIGGIGLSGIARMLHDKGYKVTGSDRSESNVTKNLRELGIEINIPHNIEVVQDQDFLIYSAVIKLDNIEIAEAHKRGIKIYSRKEFLPVLFENSTVYSVCGANGKSTTTSILASLIDSPALIGAYTKEFDSNYRSGSGKEVVFEADESDGSFASFNSYGVILTNASFEHMEYYKYDEKLFYDTYKKYLLNAKIRVINAEDSYLGSITDIECVKLYPSIDIKNISYSLVDNEPYTTFELKNYGKFTVYGFGYHVALDASLAILLTIELGYNTKDIRKNIKNYKGVVKRFDVVYNSDKLVIIDDYGHNPEEISATFESIKLYKKFSNYKNVIIIWQPHKYSRLISNLEKFKECFGKVMDDLIILPVFSVSEDVVDIDLSIEFSKYNPMCATHVKRNGEFLDIYLNDRLIKRISNGIVVGFGAGDITKQLRI